MKKLIFAFVAVVFTTGAFAQDQRPADSKAEPATAAPATASPAAATPAATNTKMATHCYAMNNGIMTHCMGTEYEPLAKDVTLKNGTIVSITGEITTKDGKKTKLANGQCVDVSGTIGDFAKMNPQMHMDDRKMEEKK